MKIRSLILALGLALASTTVFAGQCPKIMKEIDAALPNAKLSADKMAEVKKYRDEGEALHKAKKHADSVAALNKAKAILGM